MTTHGSAHTRRREGGHIRGRRRSSSLVAGAFLFATSGLAGCGSGSNPTLPPGRQVFFDLQTARSFRYTATVTSPAFGPRRLITYTTVRPDSQGTLLQWARAADDTLPPAAARLGDSFVFSGYRVYRNTALRLSLEPEDWTLLEEFNLFAAGHAGVHWPFTSEATTRSSRDRTGVRPGGLYIYSVVAVEARRTGGSPGVEERARNDFFEGATPLVVSGPDPFTLRIERADSAGVSATIGFGHLFGSTVPLLDERNALRGIGEGIEFRAHGEAIFDLLHLPLVLHDSWGAAGASIPTARVTAHGPLIVPPLRIYEDAWRVDYLFGFERMSVWYVEGEGIVRVVRRPAALLDAMVEYTLATEQ